MENKQSPRKITVYIKSPKSKDKKSLEVDENIAISEFKKLVATTCDVTPEEVALIFAGKILKDNETLDVHNVQDGYTIHMVLRARTNTSNPTTTTPTVTSQSSSTTTPPLNSMPTTDPFGGFSYLDALRGNMSGNGLTNLNMGDFRQQIEQQMLQNPEMFRQIVNNPLVQNIMSDPENIRLFVTSNPQMRELIDRNPEISHILNNPDLLRQTMELARNPAMLQELMRSHDRAISNLESIPGGYSALQRMYRDIQEPMLNAATEQHNPFIGLFPNNEAQSAANPQQGTENRDPLPNPWSRNSATPNATANPNTTPPPTRPPTIPTLPTQDPMFNTIVQQLTENPQLITAIMQTPQMQQLTQQILSDGNVANLLQNRNQDAMRQIVDNIARQMSPNVLQSLQNLTTNPEAMADIQQLTRNLRDLNIGMGNLTGENPISTTPNTNTTQSTPTVGSNTTPRPPGENPLGANPLGANPLGANLLGANPLGANPLGANPLGARPPLNPEALSYLPEFMQELISQYAPSQPPEQLYQNQLEVLRSMGFMDQAANIRALIASFGDINGAVERLLNNPPS